ncbi:MAG: hypothetical protein GWN18_03160, partial [Thermoplasmata archaeon]|nr:hypothetical protein [Thermoplasmata archaeon]NIW81584.1 hypothetical protein [Thermoplasmata archaeon]
MHVYNVVSKSGEYTVRVNGTQEYTNGTNTASFFSTGGNGGTIGKGSGAYRLAGLVGEIMIFSNSLSASDRATVEAYLQNKWASSPSSPTAHISSDWIIANDASFQDVVIENTDDTSNLESYLATGLLAGQTYYAQVRYKDASGTYGGWSNTLTFTMLGAQSGIEPWEDFRVTDP